MNFDIFQIITYIILPILTILVVPAIRGLYMSINTLQHQMLQKLDEGAVRQLVEDKVDPIKQDLQEIKGSLNQIINRLIDGK